jgi:SAM-dependent methyltransferase
MADDRAGTRGRHRRTRGSGGATAGRDYTDRLRRLEGPWWKRALDVQRPYRWNLRRLELGRTLDVGCGVGRNLVNLGDGAVGIDHNPTSVEVCNDRGLEAYTPDGFAEAGLNRPGVFDSLLLSHLLEHVAETVADEILETYLPLIAPGGRIVLITPQERGFTIDPTHIRWVDDDGIRSHCDRHSLVVVRSWSFPFPRAAGRVFPYNEFNVLAVKA